MTSLLDIGDLTETVTIRGKDLTVKGVDADGIMNLFNEHPELRQLLAGARAGEVDANTLMGLAPDILGKIIAAGLGQTGKPEYIAKAKTLTLGEQYQLIEPILRMTFPTGIGPFVEGITALIQGAAPEAVVSGWAQAMKSPAH